METFLRASSQARACIRLRRNQLSRNFPDLGAGVHCEHGVTKSLLVARTRANQVNQALLRGKLWQTSARVASRLARGERMMWLKSTAGDDCRRIRALISHDIVNKRSLFSSTRYGDGSEGKALQPGKGWGMVRNCGGKGVRWCPDKAHVTLPAASYTGEGIMTGLALLCFERRSVQRSRRDFKWARRW